MRERPRVAGPLGAASAWVEQRLREGDDRSVLEQIVAELEREPALGHASARRLHALAQRCPPAGVLDVDRDAQLIDRLHTLWRDARMTVVPPVISRLWVAEGALIGAARFPAVQEGHGAVLEIRVSSERSADVLRHDDQFVDAVEAARAWVASTLPDVAQRLERLFWTVRAPVVPLTGNSIYLAAAVAFTSLALGHPVPTHLAFTGCPAPKNGVEQVGTGGMPLKLGAVARHGAIRYLYAPTPSEWPAEDGSVKLREAQSLTDLMGDLFGNAWFDARRGGAPVLPAPSPAPALRERLRAVLAAAAVPLDAVEVHRIVHAPAWVPPTDLGGARIEDLLADDPACIRLDDGRFLLLDIGQEGRPLADPGRRAEAARMQRERDWRPPADAPCGAAAAFERLRGRPERDEAARYLAEAGSVDARRLALALLADGGPAPVARLASAVVAPRTPVDTFLVLQAISEATLHLLVAVAAALTRSGRLTFAMPPGLEERPSIGLLARALRGAAAAAPTDGIARALVAALDQDAVRRALASDGVPLDRVCNDALHHPAGWSHLLADADRLWAEPVADPDAAAPDAAGRSAQVRRGANRRLLDHGIALVGAVRRFFDAHPLVPSGGGGAALSLHVADLSLAPWLASLEPADPNGIGFYRGDFPAGPRYWGFDQGRIGRRGDDGRIQVVVPTGPSWRELRAWEMPAPLARAASTLGEEWAAGRPAWLVEATDLATAVLLRLANFVVPPRQGESFAWLVRMTKRALLRRLKALEPGDAPRLITNLERAAELIDLLERLEHHPGPIEEGAGDETLALVNTAAALCATLLDEAPWSQWQLVGRRPRGGALVDLTGFKPRAWDGPPVHLTPGQVAMVRRPPADKGSDAPLASGDVHPLGLFARVGDDGEVSLLAQVRRAPRSGLHKAQEPQYLTPQRRGRTPALWTASWHQPDQTTGSDQDPSPR